MQSISDIPYYFLLKNELQAAKAQWTHSTTSKSTTKQHEGCGNNQETADAKISQNIEYKPFSSASTQTEDQINEAEASPSFEDLLSQLQREFCKLEQAACLAQTNDGAEMLALRQIINGSLGENWSLMVFENEKVRGELQELSNRIAAEKKNTELVNSDEEKITEIQDSEKYSTYVENMKNLSRSADTGQGKDLLENSSMGNLHFKVYDQDKILATFEMDKAKLLQYLDCHVQVSKIQRSKCQFDELDGTVGAFPESTLYSDICAVEEKELDGILQETLKDLVTAQKENKSVKKENDLLKTKSQSLQSALMHLNKLVELGAKDRFASHENGQTWVLTNFEDVEVEYRIGQGLGPENEESQDEVEVNVLKNLESFIRERNQINLILPSCNCSKVEQGSKETCMCASELETETELREGCFGRPCEHKDGKSHLADEAHTLNVLSQLQECKRHSCNLALKTDSPISQKGPAEKEDSKLNSELIVTKEKLVRLKAELTLSNVQTKNLGSQLSCLREDSSKLEAELSTIRRSPTRGLLPRSPSFNRYDETLRLEIELAEAKERIIDLQERLLSFHKEKSNLQKQLLNRKEELQRMGDELENNKEQILGYNKEMEKLKQDLKNSQVKDDSLKQTPDKYTEIPNKDKQPFDKIDEQGQSQKLRAEMSLLIQERNQLQRDLANANDERCRLESVEDLVQQLISVEDEKMKLKKCLKRWAVEASREEFIGRSLEPNVDEMNLSQTDDPKSALEEELEETTSENCLLRSEVETLKDYVLELEKQLHSAKFEISVNEAIKSKSNKKALAILLATVKCERSELKQSVDALFNDKEHLEEELMAFKVQSARVQRDLAMSGIEKECLEQELFALRKAVAKAQGKFPSVTQNSAPCGQLGDLLSDDVTSSPNGAGSENVRPRTCDGRKREKNKVIQQDNAPTSAKNEVPALVFGNKRRAPYQTRGAARRQVDKFSELTAKLHKLSQAKD